MDSPWLFRHTSNFSGKSRRNFILLSVSFVIFFLSGGLSFASMEAELIIDARDHTMGEMSPGYLATTLWDQTGYPGSGCSPAQYFLDVGAAVLAADDFTVSNAAGWTVSTVFIDGTYRNPGRKAVSWDVFIFSDVSGSPGSVVFSALDLPASGDLDGDIYLTLPAPADLPQGTYWLSVVADLAFNPGQQQFFWCRRSYQTLNEFHWIDPNNLFGLGCTIWAPGSACLGASNPDLLFSLGGEQNSFDFTVDTEADTYDANPGDRICADSTGACSLRAAIEETNVQPGKDRIFLPAGDYLLNLGQLDVTDDLVLIGAGPDLTEINGQNTTNLMSVDKPACCMTFEVSDLAFINGNGAYANAAGLFLDRFVIGTVTNVWVMNNVGGKGLKNGGAPGSLIIRDSLVQGNSGGGMSVSYVLIENTKVISNTSFGAGGIYISGYGRINDSEIVNNTSTGNLSSGGGIYGEDDLVIRNSLIANNSAKYSGGGIFFDNGQRIAIFNSTIVGNMAGRNGGGLRAYTTWNNTSVIANSTIVGNTADADNDGVGNGGGITGGNLRLALRNSIVYGNVDLGGEAPDCNGGFISEDYNLVGDLTGCNLIGNVTFSIFGLDPLLAPLADNGGPTQTMALQPGSPALGAGSCFDRNNNYVVFDQRGFLRPPQGCDMGAFELNLGLPAYLPIVGR